MNKYLTKSFSVMLNALMLTSVLAGRAFATPPNFKQLNEHKWRDQLKAPANSDIHSLVRLQRQKLRDLATQNPSQKRQANIYFSQGINSTTLGKLLANKAITAKHAQAQVYLPKSQTTLYPKSLEMQLGDKGAKPHELSILSDWGSRVQSTTLQFQG